MNRSDPGQVLVRRPQCETKLVAIFEAITARRVRTLVRESQVIPLSIELDIGSVDPGTDEVYREGSDHRAACNSLAADNVFGRR